MIVLKLIIGAFFFSLGWIYLFKSNLVIKINKIARDTFFNDRTVLLERKKMAILFFCLSFVALFMGISSLTGRADPRQPNGDPTINSRLLYQAMQDFYRKDFGPAIEKYKNILLSEPNNVIVIKRLARAYEASGEPKKALALYKRALQLDPQDRETADKLKQLMNNGSGK